MENQVKFPEEKDAFYATVKARVNQYFLQTGKTKYGNSFFYFKVVLFLTFHVFFLFDASFFPKFLGCIYQHGTNGTDVYPDRNKYSA